MGIKTTILIVDDHPFFREGLKSFLAKNPGYTVIGEAATGKEALEKATELKPKLIILDISLPDISGIELCRRFKERLPDSLIVILSMHSKVDYVAEALKAGATGYVTKESAGEKIFDCFEAILRGDYFLDAALHRPIVEKLTSTDKITPRDADDQYHSLTAREQEVFLLLARGLSVQQVAERLFISKKTVENHRSNVMSKLELHSTLEMVRYALKRGLIGMDEWTQ